MDASTQALLNEYRDRVFLEIKRTIKATGYARGLGGDGVPIINIGWADNKKRIDQVIILSFYEKGIVTVAGDTTKPQEVWPQEVWLSDPDCLPKLIIAIKEAHGCKT